MPPDRRNRSHGIAGSTGKLIGSIGRVAEAAWSLIRTAVYCVLIITHWTFPLTTEVPNFVL